MTAQHTPGLGTAYVRRAYTIVKRAGVERERWDGYDLFINGQWHERYSLANEARAAARAMGFQVVKEEAFQA